MTDPREPDEKTPDDAEQPTDNVEEPMDDGATDSAITARPPVHGKGIAKRDTVGEYSVLNSENQILYQLNVKNLKFVVGDPTDDVEAADDAKSERPVDEEAGEGPPTEKYRRDDPTLPFPARAGAPRYRVDEAEVHLQAIALEQQRLIAVRSPDDGLTSAAVHTLLDLDRFRPLEHRLLAFPAASPMRERVFLDNLTDQPIGDPDRPALVVVDGDGGLPFVESALGSDDWARAMTEKLRDKEMLVVVQIGSRYRQRLEQVFGGFHFPLWEVEFLRPLLLRYQPPGTVEELFARISVLRQRGRWGSPDDVVAQFEILQPLIRGELGRLEDALEPHDDRLVRLPSALETLDQKISIYQGILLCAAYFQGLDVTEFSRLVLGLVGREKVFDNVGELDTKGEISLRRRQQTLEEAWPQVGDWVLRKCGLVVRRTDGHSAVTFARPDERGALRHRTRNSIYFANMGATLWRKGHLFNPGASQELIDGAISIYVDALAHHNEWCRPEWLSEALRARLVDGEGEGEDLQRIHRNQLYELIIDRLSQLLRSLVVHEHYSQLVQNWLGDLMRHKGHRPALKLAANLRYAEGFDYLFWLKRFSDESPNDVRNVAYSALYRHARQSSIRIWSFLDELKSWLPERDRPATMLSNSGNFALQLIVEYAIDTAVAVPPDQYGQWPSHYPLFRGLAADAERAEERLDLLVDWLLHPAIPLIFRRYGDELAWTFRMLLLELWTRLLLGLEEGDPQPQALSTYRRLLELYCDRTERDERRRLLQAGRAARADLENRRRRGDRAGAAQIARLVGLSRRLERDFKEVAGERKAPARPLRGIER